MILALRSKVQLSDANPGCNLRSKKVARRRDFSISPESFYLGLPQPSATYASFTVNLYKACKSFMGRYFLPAKKNAAFLDLRTLSYSNNIGSGHSPLKESLFPYLADLSERMRKGRAR